MELADFTADLTRLSAADIRTISAGIESNFRTPDDEVAWWHTTMTVDRLLRRTGRTRAAALAAQAATEAVKTAAGTAGIPGPDEDVIRVARGAAHVARALSLSPGAVRLDHLVRGWEHWLGGVGREPVPAA